MDSDPEQAALLAGAVQGLLRGVGLWGWPSHRRQEAELVARLRQALGTARAEQLLAAGARLTRRAAVATVRDQHGSAVS